METLFTRCFLTLVPLVLFLLSMVYVVYNSLQMAERSAHLTPTTQQKPSIFDYIAQENLNNLLHPAIKRVIETLYASYPQTEGIWRWFEEGFLAGSSIIQYYYLKKYGSTFSETFYGLRRVAYGEERFHLTRKEILLSIATACLIPYLRNKLSAKADELYFTNVPRDKMKWKQFVLGTNSTFQVMLQVFNFIEHLRYLGGQSEYNSPLLRLIGLKLQYSNPQEEEPFTLKNAFPIILKRSFELGAFFLQFYHWWMTENKGFGALPIPPPPEENGPSFDGKCPICREPRQIQTALAVSGYVFCFNCICRYVQEHNKCPVTNLPATFEDLIRVYPPSV